MLQPASALVAAGRVPGNWLVARKSQTPAEAASGWVLAKAGIGWDLYKSGTAAGTVTGNLAGSVVGTSALEGPKSAHQKGLPGCNH